MACLARGSQVLPAAIDEVSLVGTSRFACHRFRLEVGQCSRISEWIHQKRVDFKLERGREGRGRVVVFLCTPVLLQVVLTLYAHGDSHEFLLIRHRVPI